MDLLQADNTSLMTIVSRPFIDRLQRVGRSADYYELKQNTIDRLDDEPTEFMYAADQGELVPDDAGAYAYSLSCLLEVMDPALAADVDAITKLHKIADEWTEAVNKAMKADD